MPRKPLDPLKNLPKVRRSQVAFGQLEDEVPCTPDQPAADLAQSLLQARQRSTLDGQGQDEPSEQIAEVVRDAAQEPPHLVGPEAVTGEARPMGGFFALLDPLLRRPAAVVAVDDGPGRLGERGNDDAHARKEFPEMMLDLSGDPLRPVPGGGLILDPAIADQRGVAGRPRGLTRRSSMARSRTALARRRMAYATFPRSSAS